LGAARRLEELRAEEADIVATFPDLGKKTQANFLPKASRKAYRMSPEARRAVGARMKKYWAERRKGKEPGHHYPRLRNREGKVVTP